MNRFSAPLLAAALFLINPAYEEAPTPPDETFDEDAPMSMTVGEALDGTHVITRNPATTIGMRRASTRLG